MLSPGVPSSNHITGGLITAMTQQLLCIRPFADPDLALADSLDIQCVCVYIYIYVCVCVCVYVGFIVTFKNKV